MYKHKKNKGIKIESSFVFEKNKNIEPETINKTETINKLETVIKSEIINKPEIINEIENINKLVIINESEIINKTEIINETETINKPEIINESETINKTDIINETIYKLEIFNETEIINKPETIIEAENKESEILESRRKIDTLCFSGGGVKGLSFVGALEKLIESKIINLEDITLFVGTSAGAMLSFLLNLGWSIKEIKDFIINFNFSKLIGEIDSINFFEYFGIENGDRLKLLFIKFLESKFDKKDITFKELFDLTNKKLIIIGTNLTQSCEKVFSVDETPDFSIIIALRISCSIPIIFLPVEYNKEFYVDGGIVNNFPINYCSKKSTLGFYVKNCNTNIIDSVESLISATLRLTADTISEKNIKKYMNCIIQIKNTELNISNFDINLEHKLKIMELGYKSSELYIKNNFI